ncbi:MAG: hypothetical protein RLZZ387_641 [Chloroflexota bacterium]
MFPLIQIGPLNLSAGGLLLLVAAFAASSIASRVARARGGDELVSHVESASFAAAVGALIGARLWYGLFNWDLYGSSPGLFLAPRLAELAWPGGLLGGMLAGWLWARLRSGEPRALADVAALTLPAAQAIASVGLLLSGDAFGTPTDLPWGVTLFGTSRHPTQLYFALAALAGWAVLLWLARRPWPAGALFTAYLGLQGLSLLLIEALRADSLLLPASVRAGQVFGLALLIVALGRAPVVHAPHAERGTLAGDAG